MNPTQMKPEDRPTPETDAARTSTTLPGAMGYVPADLSERLERQRDEAREQCKYWKGVVRGARAELSAMERITMEEYAALCTDTECRDYVDQMDALKNQRDRLLEALEDTKPLLIGIESDLGEPLYRRERAKRLLRAFESALTGAKGAK